MEYTGCYNSTVEVVNEATQQFEQFFKLNDSKFAELDGICAAVDEFVREIEPERVDVSVSNSKQLIIDIGCDDVIFERGRSSAFFSLIQKVSSFSFSKDKNVGLRIALNIDGLWERACG